MILSAVLRSNNTVQYNAPSVSTNYRVQPVQPANLGAFATDRTIIYPNTRTGGGRDGPR